MSTEKVKVGEKAISCFDQGKNCAEAVFLALSEELGVASRVTPGIATGFGGGFGRNGFVCGAVSAGTMIIGLKGEGKGKKLVYPVVDRFLSEFKSRFGSVNCCDLMGVDLKTEEGMTYLKEKGHKKCRGFVRYSANKVKEILDSDDTLG